MSKKPKSRRFTVKGNMRILEEARQPNTTVAEVEKRAKKGMREALEGKRRNGKGLEREVEWLEAELEKKRGVIAEVVEENLELRKGL